MLGAINKLGVLGTVFATVLSLGCCAGVLGPVVLFAAGLLDWVPVAWQLPLLYASLALALLSFGLGWSRHRRLPPLLLFLSGAAALLYPLQEALDVSVFRLLIGLGFALILAVGPWETWLAVRTGSCAPALGSAEAPRL